MDNLRRLLEAARAGRTRREIADLTATVEGGSHVTTKDIEHLECYCRTPPDGSKLRTLAHVLDLNWVQVLDAMGYWPPLGGSETDPIFEVAAHMRLGSFRTSDGGSAIKVPPEAK